MADRFRWRRFFQPALSMAETANVAMMESSGVPGSIQISAASYALLKGAYVCERRAASST